MDCPYCAEAVKDSALVCKHCQRDLFVVRPLIEKLAETAGRLEALEAVSSGEVLDAARRLRAGSPAHSLPGVEPVAAMALTFIALVAAHYVIIVEYSLPLIVLRIVSIAVPLAFGFLCRADGRPGIWTEFLYGVVIALASILVMSKIVGRIDSVPVLPRNFVEWREFAEYGASITFGFFTGVIIRQMVIAMRSPGIKPPWLVDRLSRAIVRKIGDKPGFNMATIRSLVSAAAAAGSGIASLVTGLSQFF